MTSIPIDSSVDPTPFRHRTKYLSNHATQIAQVLSGGDPFPVDLEVNISNYCDQNCGWCINADVRDDGTFLDIASPKVERFFRDYKRLGGQFVGWSGGGEPTCHPKFDEALQLVGSIGLPQGLITHGAFRPQLVDPIARTCKWVRVSLDTYDRNAYADRRRTTPDRFDRVLSNVRALVSKKAVVGINMNVARWNIDHMRDFYALGVELGVSYVQFRPTLPTPFQTGDEGDHLDLADVSSVLESARQLRAEAGARPEVIISEDKFLDLQKPKAGRRYKGCKSHRMFVVLHSNGDLKVCMYHLTDDRFVLGNVHEQSLEEIWQSEKRKGVLSFCEGSSVRSLDHAMHGCQVCCKGHEINKILLDSALLYSTSGS